MSYKPYTGGAGPSKRQAINNDKALLEELIKNGIEAEYLEDKEYNATQGFECREKTIRFKKNGKVYHVSYDRWGFVMDSDDCNMFLDQVSLEAVIAVVKTL